MSKRNERGPGGRRRLADDEGSGDFFFRLRTEPAMQAGALAVVAALLVGAGVWLVSFERGRAAAAHFEVAGGKGAVDASVYADFFGIEFGTAYDRLPAIGDDVGFGAVRGVGVGQDSFTADLKAPLFNFFGSVRVGLSGRAGEAGRRVVSLTFTKEGGGVDPEKARKGIAKIASLVGSRYGIDMGEPQAAINNSYFSQTYRNAAIDIRVSCAVSQKATSFFLSVENLAVKEAADRK